MLLPDNPIPEGVGTDCPVFARFMHQWQTGIYSEIAAMDLYGGLVYFLPDIPSLGGFWLPFDLHPEQKGMQRTCMGFSTLCKKLGAQRIWDMAWTATKSLALSGQNIQGVLSWFANMQVASDATFFFFIRKRTSWKLVPDSLFRDDRGEPIYYFLMSNGQKLTKTLASDFLAPSWAPAGFAQDQVMKRGRLYWEACSQMV